MRMMANKIYLRDIRSVNPKNSQNYWCCLPFYFSSLAIRSAWSGFVGNIGHIAQNLLPRIYRRLYGQRGCFADCLLLWESTENKPTHLHCLCSRFSWRYMMNPAYCEQAIFSCSYTKIGYRIVIWLRGPIVLPILGERSHSLPTPLPQNYI